MPKKKLFSGWAQTSNKKLEFRITLVCDRKSKWKLSPLPAILFSAHIVQSWATIMLSEMYNPTLFQRKIG